MIARAHRTREINWFPFTAKTYNRLHTLLGLRHREHGISAAFFRLLRPLFLLVLACQAAALAGEGNGHLWLTVDVPPGRNGAIGYLVFNSPGGFPQNAKTAVERGFISEAHSGQSARIDLGQLPPGRYAISAYLDENGNRKLDSSWLGIPKEPVGASNNPRPRRGPPRFEECAFQLGVSNETVSIHLEIPQ